MDAVLDAAREAAKRGDWATAYEKFVDADARQVVSGPDLALLAEAAYSTAHVDLTIDAWERLHAEALKRQDALTAAGAAVRVALHLLFDTALLGPVRGWAARAESLLEGRPATPVHAWLAVVRSNERLHSGDFGAAGEWARRAIAFGAVHDPGAAALGRVAEARAVVLQGDVDRGLHLLQEAAVAIVSGEIDPLATGVVYCEVVCALQGMAQFDLADQWTQAMERWCRTHRVGSLHGRCRVHRAEILRLRGDCASAEREAQAACDELRPYLRREFGWPLNELGRIRLRRGNLDGAASAFDAARQTGWDPQPGLALVRLARGDIRGAADEIRVALAHPLNVPSKELPPHSDLCRAPLLDAAIDIELAAGHIEAARAASTELTAIAAAFNSRALDAAAASGRGRVQLAGSDVTIATREFDAAVRQWSEIGAPYEAAIARLGLAAAYRAAGNETRALAEFRAASATFDRIGAVDHSRRTTPPLDALPRAADLSSQLRREDDHWVATFAGQTVRLRDTKGLRYLSRLLSEPQHEFRALDLAGGHVTVPDASDAGSLLDERAKQAYRRRLSEIDTDLKEAHRLQDAARTAQATAEREFLRRELSRAVGLGGRDRRAGSAAERARVSVTRAIRQAIDRVRVHHRALADHFDRTIRTGVYCAYQPDPRVPTDWRTS